MLAIFLFENQEEAYYRKYEKTRNIVIAQYALRSADMRCKNANDKRRLISRRSKHIAYLI